MRRRSVALMLLACFVLLASCNESAVSDDPTILVQGDWACYDADMGEAVGVTFTEDFEYFYNCDCGEPVGNSDLYDTYSYNADERIIILSGPDDEVMTVNILYADENYLSLMIEDEAVVFKNRKSEIDDSVRQCAEHYIENGMMSLCLLEYENGTITVAPYDYDRDAHKRFADKIYTLMADDDIEFYSVSITDEEGEVYMEDFRLAEDDYPDIGEFYNYGFFKLGKDGQIEKVVFYGETIVE